MKNKLLKEMELTFLNVVTGIGTKAVAILSSCWGWLVSIIASLLAYFVGLKIMVTLLGVILLIDLIVGIIAAHRRGENITSDKLRNTIVKALIYLIILPLAYSIEIEIGFGMLVHKLLWGLAAIVELYSITANALIIAPNMPFLKFFTGLVSGEIAKKLSITKEEVNDVLQNNNK
jgi:phage-related holin